MAVKELAFFICLATFCLFVESEGKSVRDHSDHRKKAAFDKIAEIDLQFGQIKDSQHYDGDMKLPPLVTYSRSRRSLNGERVRRGLHRETVKLWPGGVIPYVIAQDLKRKTGFYQLIMGAIKAWEKKTCLRFKERTTERNYAFLYDGPGCQSDVGFKGEGIQTTSLGTGCDDHGIIVHELGHLIGLYHEQNRPDRDKYITILLNNIKSNLRHTYDIKEGWHPKSVTGPYDYYSVMHYGSGDFRKSPGLPTMQAKVPHITHFGGNRVTTLDAKKVRKMYQCPEYPDFPRDFYWSYSGRNRYGKTCIRVNEPRDPKWQKGYLCYNGINKKPLNLRWSYSGPIKQMACEKITEPTKPNSYSWNDNYLCLPNNAPYRLKWVLTRPSWSERRRSCLKINNPQDGTWNRKYHYLCVASRNTDLVDGQWSAWNPWSKCTRQCGGGLQYRARTCTSPPPSNGGVYCSGEKFENRECNKKECREWPSFPKDFSFGKHDMPPFDDICFRTYDLNNYFTWINYYFCTKGGKINPGFKWGTGRRIPGMQCTRIYNPIENRYTRGSWNKNYLCVPQNSPYRFSWSIRGPIPGKTCMRWYAKNGRDGWDKTYLCNDVTRVLHRLRG